MYSCQYCNQDMNQIGSSHGYPIYQCPVCSFVSVKVDNFDPFGIYGIGYLSGRYKGTQSFYQDYFSKEKTLRVKFGKILDIIGNDDSDLTLFEMGCGAGFFLDEANKRGYCCFGTEVSSEGLEHCKELGLFVSRNNTLPKNPFHVCVAIDVIEHLPNPFDVLRQLYDLSSRVLVIETVFVDGIKDLIGWEMMQPPRHLSFMTKKHINEMFDVKPTFHKVAYGTLCVWRKS